MNEEYFKKIANLLDEKLAASEKRLNEDIGYFIEKNLIPQLEEKADKKDLKDLATKSDIDRIERKLDKALAKNVEQDQRLTEIESLPAIAHQLKSKSK